MRISRRVQLNRNYLIASLAIIFVGYHLSQIVLLPINLSSTFMTHSTAPVVSHNQVVKTSSSSAQLKTNPILLGFQTNDTLWPTHVSIPAVGIDLPLTSSFEQNGAWDISLTGANFALNTAVPNGQSGNTVLFGHDRPNLFHAIHDLKIDQLIDVATPLGTYTYKMTSSEVVSPTNVSVMDQSTDSTLTLLTCDGWLSENRYTVHAEFVSFIAKPSPTPTSVNRSSDLASLTNSPKF